MGALPPDADAMTSREVIRLRGIVQGVGMRPFVFALAERFALSGFVRNDPDGVTIDVEGERIALFAASLSSETPPLARIDSIERTVVEPRGGNAFVISSSTVGTAMTGIPADAATCESCLDELFDPVSRFHLYPFINCTNCGPRYTITRRVPYDRPMTAMAPFAMCPDCARAYADPRDRRFHAEPVACRGCGPRMSHSMGDIANALRSGQIVALKGVGGFHLMCDATREEAVATLRRRKQRDSKPFAVMIANAASAPAFAVAAAASLALLRTPARPIVVMPMRPSAIAPSVAPNLARIGLVLPYAPIHHLLMHALLGAPTGHAWRSAPQDIALVATSANPSGEPLIVDDVEAQQRLGGIADLIVTHDRAIVVRADDSVMTIADGAPAFVRRARGFVPEPIDLGEDGPCVVGVGAHLKTTVTLTRGREAFVSQHVGDLDTAAALRFHRETIAHLMRVLDITPDIVVCDRHPDYGSTREAERMGRPLLRVQHHAAHVAAIAAEHRRQGPVLGVALDGHGLGDDGGNWGGELMLVSGARWQRIGHLAPLALPGGERAAREPWRMALAALHAIGRADPAAYLSDVPLARQAASLVARAPTTTSLGRLFDAAAGLLNVRRRQDHEGQAAMELEALVRTPRIAPAGWRITDDVLDLRPLLALLAEPAMDRAAGAELFHGTLVAALAEWISAAARRLGHAHVALGGGCLMNVVLADGLSEALRARGLVPLHARAVPPNDGGLSLGQVALARAARI